MMNCLGNGRCRTRPIRRRSGGPRTVNVRILQGSSCLAALGLILIASTTSGVLAQSEFQGLISQPPQRDYRLALVRVQIDRDTSGVRFGNQYLGQVRLKETHILQGVIVDPNGFVVTYTGEGLTPDIDSSGLKIVVETVDGHRVAAELVGVDSRVNLLLLRARSLRDRNVWIADPTGGSNLYFLRTAIPDTEVITPKFTETTSRDGLPYAEIRASLVYSQLKAIGQGSFVFDGAGRLVGIVTDLLDRSVKNIERFYVLSGSALEDSFNRMKRPPGRIVAGFLGINAESHRDCTVVQQVIPGTPAEKAGLQAGDEILRLDGVRRTMWDFGAAIRWKGAGNPLQIELRRSGGILTVTAILGEKRPEPEKTVLAIDIAPEWTSSEKPAEGVRIYRAPPPPPLDLGLFVQELTPDWARKLKCSAEGVLVQKVVANSPATGTFEVGDVILSMNGQSTCSVAEFYNAFQSREVGRFQFEVCREGQRKTFELAIR